MSEPPHSDQISLHNKQSINTLARAILLSQGEFSLILVRCNYAFLRERMMQQLRHKCDLEIQELELPPTSTTLYTAISTAIDASHPQALAVFGLETVREIDTVLASTNQVREEFRKSFAFPLLLWVNDDILRKLIKQVPDLESWASVVEFDVSPHDLTSFVQAVANDIFNEFFEMGAAPFLNELALELRADSRLSTEVHLARADIQQQQIPLGAELTASLEFLVGLAEGNLLSGSREYLERSLSLWPTDIEPSHYACVAYQMGLWWRTYAVENRSEYDESCQKAAQFFRKAIAAFESENATELVAKFINPLGEALQRLKEWDKLESIGRKSLTLNQDIEDHYRQAQASGLIAEALLGKSDWEGARRFAEQAIQLLEAAIANEPVETSPARRGYVDWHKSFNGGWHLFTLGQAQWALEQHQAAIETLEAARTEARPDYDPPLYIQILRTLRTYYFEQKEYLKAFDIRLEYRSLEQQYGFRAFVGAGRLQPKRESANPALVGATSQKKHRVSQEIAASGRLGSVNRLIERLGRADQKLIVLHGQSGVGKSSIVQAGLIPSLDPITLDTRSVITVLQQVYTNWTEHLSRELVAVLKEVGLASLPQMLESPQEMLKQLRNSVEQNLTVVLIFDQFEEFFFVHKEPSQRRSFYTFLKQCLDIPYVKVILSLREDYLHYLLECNDRLINFDVINNNILDKSILFYLGNFTRKEAESVFQSLTKDTPYPLSTELTEELVNDLSEELGEIRPIEVQVVGSQLQTEQITTLEDYKEKGPKDSLVSRFLDEVTHDCM